MNSRYTTIRPSLIHKDVGDSPIPDIFTFPQTKFKVKEKPLRHTMTQVDIDRFDILMERYYKTTKYSDLILWFNKIMDIDEMEAGDVIDLYSREDLERFLLENYV